MEIANRFFKNFMDSGKDPKEVISKLKEDLEYFRTEKSGLITTSALNSVGKEFGNLILQNGIRVDNLKDLWERGDRDVKIILISALEILTKNFTSEIINFVLEAANHIDNWEICDQMALKVTVHLLIARRKRMESIISKWLKSNNFWLRRLAIATIPPFIRRKPDESVFCLKLIDQVMLDDSREVKKAVAWALREISKKDGTAVREFIVKWARSGDKRVLSVLKQGIKKLPPEDQETVRIYITK